MTVCWLIVMFSVAMLGVEDLQLVVFADCMRSERREY